MSAESAPSSVLLIKPGSFGDIVHALPCAAALKHHWPQAKLTWLVDERWAALLDENPCIDTVVTFPREHFRGLAGKVRSIPWALGLKRLKPDIALDLQGLIRSALMGKLSRARRIVGLADAREGASWFYHEITPVNSREHAVRRYLRSLGTLGLPQPNQIAFPLPAGTRPAGFLMASPFILIHPFARGAGKSLSEEQVTHLSTALQPHRVAIAGTGKLTGQLPENTMSLLNQTSIPEMIWLLRNAEFVISVDSGPMHVAAAVGTKLLSIHTWSDPQMVGPFSDKAWVWQGGEIRRQELDRREALPSARSLERADLDQVARLANEQMATPD